MVDICNFYILLFTLLSISSVKKHVRKKFKYLNNYIITYCNKNITHTFIIRMLCYNFIC